MTRVFPSCPVTGDSATCPCPWPRAHRALVRSQRRDLRVSLGVPFSIHSSVPTRPGHSQGPALLSRTFLYHLEPSLDSLCPLPACSVSSLKGSSLEPTVSLTPVGVTGAKLLCRSWLACTPILHNRELSTRMFLGQYLPNFPDQETLQGFSYMHQCRFRRSRPAPPGRPGTTPGQASEGHSVCQCTFLPWF